MSTPDSRMHSPTQRGAKNSIIGPTPGSRGFWFLFTAGWLGYMGLVLAATFLEGQATAPGLLMTLPPFVLATLVAWHMRYLMDPDRALVKFAGILLLTGILFTGLSALCSTGLLWALDIHEAAMRGRETALLFAKLILYAAVLFALLAGFLTWTVSVERLQESRTLAAREAVLRANAEANAVRARFNPHFVFNTLHSLMTLAREDPGTAERAIEDVASLIRYASSLDRRGQDVVTLSQEMEIAKKYLALERLRLEDRLEVVWEVADELSVLAVPAFARGWLAKDYPARVCRDTQQEITHQGSMPATAVLSCRCRHQI